MKMFYGIIFIITAQIISFVQLQFQGKYEWFRDNTFWLVFLGLPSSYLFIYSTKFINEYTGQTWPGRLIGQSIGTVLFAVLSWFIFREPITLKTGICILLALIVVLIQIFWK